MTVPSVVIHADDLNAPDVPAALKLHRSVVSGPGGPLKRVQPLWSLLARNWPHTGICDGVIDGVTDEDTDLDEVNDRVGVAESEIVGEADGDAVPPKSMAAPLWKAAKTRRSMMT
jgi:hypothetical protein